MHIEFKYVALCLNFILLDFGTNSDHVRSVHTSRFSPGNLRIKRQAGYVYDRPTVSFDLPTATSIATTQAPNVDIDRMQMYYAYPVPAGGAADPVNVVQQNTIASGGTSTSVSSGASGYNYGVQNTQITGSQSTGNQNIGTTGYQSTAVTGTQTVVSSGSAGYNSDRPSPAFNSGVTTGSVSTSAPRYLPPQVSNENTASVSVTTSNQAQTGSSITQTSDTYIPPSVQVSSPGNVQTVSVAQTVTNSQTPSANVASPNTGYILPNPTSQQTAIISSNPTSFSSAGQTQTKTVQSVPTQQYLPPIESSVESKSFVGPVSAPASTYLPPVF